MTPRSSSALPLALVGLREAQALLQAGLASVDRTPLPTSIPRPGFVPTVLVHGYLATASALRPLARRLLAEGVPDVRLVGYPSTRLRIEEVVDAIAAVAVPLARAHGPVDVVGHSLGAFATRLWLKRYDGARHVRRFVSLGGPHAGTALHRLMVGPLRGVLDPEGAWVRALADGPEPVPTYVVRARYDHQVFPPEAACIPGVHEVVVDGAGHNALLFAPEAHDAVVAALRGDADQREAGSSS